MTRILVADDDCGVRTAISSLLQKEGIDVVMVNDASAALQSLAREHFDLVILDIFMPGMDGLETIRALRQQRPQVPIIAMSGLRFPATSIDPPDFLEMAAKLGAAGSLSKPFEPGELLATIRACLGGPRDEGRSH